MTREELKRHCEKQVEECERWAKHKGKEPHGKIYEEHKLILELLANETTRKKGKWIFAKTIFDKHGCTVECSSCHKRWKTYDEIRWRKENKFCPNCGDEKENKKAENDTEKRKEWPRKPCINYEDGCEEWAGCPCVHYKAEKESEYD